MSDTPAEKLRATLEANRRFIEEVQKHLNTEHRDCPPVFRK